MAVIYWWLIPVWVVIVLGTVWLYIRFKKKHTAKVSNRSVAIAHGERLRSLPSYQQVYRRYRLLLAASIATIVVALVVGIVLSARPVSQDLVTPQQKNRDIMLCLDVSSSMNETNAQVFQTFIELIDQYQGQRVGLTAFNSSGVTVFPLTDDYEYIKPFLQQGNRAFTALKTQTITSMDDKTFQDYTSIYSGVSSNTAAGASLIGDGLATCINRMGNNEQGRSQSVIFATDNELNGDPIVTTLQAAAYAQKKNVRIYAIDPGSQEAFTSRVKQEHADLKTAALSTGGQYYETQTVQVSDIIAEISKQEAVLFSAPPELVRTDTPLPYFVGIVVLVLAIGILSWRLRL